MCKSCDGNKVIIEVIDPHIQGYKKFNKAIEVLAKATRTNIFFDDDREKSEPTPYLALRELDEELKKQVAAGLGTIYAEICKKWIRVSTKKAAESDPFMLNGQTYLNPQTGQMLTVKEWKAITKDLDSAFGYLYGETQESLAKRALALGKILNTMEPDSRIDTSLADSGVDVILSNLSAEDVWKNMLNYAEIHTGELIQDITSANRRRVMDVILDSYKDRLSPRELESKLFDTFSELNRDWRRIAETETATNFNNGYLMSESEQRKSDDEVIYMKGLSSADACDWCVTEVNEKIVVLLDNPPSGGDQVDIDGHTYTAIWPGKSNFGRKRSNWWVASGSQHPHCYSEDTKVLTDKGFKLFKDVNESDLIVSMNPKTEIMEYVKWVNRVDYFYTGSMYNFKSRGVDLLVTDGHSMVYRIKKLKKLRFDRADGLVLKRSYMLPSVAIWEGRKASDYERLLCRFFGWYVSEGYVVVRKSGACQLSISQYNPDKKDRISKILEDLNVKHFVGKSDITVYGDFARWVNGLQLGKSYEKRVPEFIKYLDSEAIREFLYEFNLGDGSRRVRDCFGSDSEEVVYYTSSKRLVSDLCELILKTGKSPVITLHSKSGTSVKHSNGVYKQKYDVFKVSESKAKNRHFRSDTQSTVDGISYSGMVHCLELEKNHIMCVERAGSVIWCGNCRCTWTRYLPGYEKYEERLRKKLEQLSANR